MCTGRVVVLADLADPGMVVHVGLGPDEECHTGLLADIGEEKNLARLVAYISCLPEKG